MARLQDLGPLDPIFDIDKSLGAIAVGNTPGGLILRVTINQASGQTDPVTDGSDVLFDVIFTEPVTGFATGDVTLTGTAGATTGVVTDLGSGDAYLVTVSGMTMDGTVIADIAASVAVAVSSGFPNQPSTSTDNIVTWEPFDVLSAPWQTFYATVLPRFVAFGYGNGATLTNFPDEMDLDGGPTDMTATTPKPTVNVPGGSFNGKPSIDCNGTQGIRSGVSSNSAGPRTMFVIGRFRDTTTGKQMTDSDGGGGRFRLSTTATGWRFDAGSANFISGGTKDTSPHCWVGFGNGASTSELNVDGTTTATGVADASPWGGVGLALSAIGGVYSDVEVVAYGTISGDLTSDDPALWSDFKQWVEGTYGIAMA